MLFCQLLEARRQVRADAQAVFLELSRSITSSTARPIAQHTGLPPNVLK